MSLTRSLIKGLGLNEEQTTAIIEAHTETVNALKAQRDSFKDQLDKIEKEGGDWKTKYENEHTAFETYKDEQSKKAGKDAIRNAYKNLLNEAGISNKRIDAVLKVSDLDKIELNKDGSIKGADKLKESIKTEWADFITTVNTTGTSTEYPPVNNGGSTMTKEEIMKIKDPRERQAKIAENISLFQK